MSTLGLAYAGDASLWEAEGNVVTDVTCETISLLLFQPYFYIR